MARRLHKASTPPSYDGDINLSSLGHCHRKTKAGHLTEPHQSFADAVERAQCKAYGVEEHARVLSASYAPIACALHETLQSCRLPGRPGAGLRRPQRKAGRERGREGRHRRGQGFGAFDAVRFLGSGAAGALTKAVRQSYRRTEDADEPALRREADRVTEAAPEASRW